MAAPSVASSASGSTRSRSTPKSDMTSRTSDVAYRLIRLLFRFVLTLFYGHIIVENLDNLSSDGQPTLLLANHSNSLTDALIVMASVPRKKRRCLRMTAKATHFRRGNFSSWLIEKAGSVPLMRAKDYEPTSKVKVDNKAVLDMLHTAIESGDCVAMFPEGISRYHPQVAPLKTGAARIAADVMQRQKDNPHFKLDIVTCSITYLHRANFRSDVLVSFNPPITLRAESRDALTASLISTDDAVRREGIRKLTDMAAEQIRTGTLDSPSWSHLRCAHTARRLYAPLGTQMPLGEHVRLTQRFVDALAGKRAVLKWKDTDNIARALKTPMLLDLGGKENGTPKQSTDYFSMPPTSATSNGGARLREPASVSPMERSPSMETLLDGYSEDGVDVAELLKDLKSYQDDLVRFGVKDDRVRNNRLLHRHIILKRLVVRVLGVIGLFILCAPGLCLWAPIFYITWSKAEGQKRKGPIWDTYDEITQTKLVWGLASGLCVYFGCLLFTFPLIPITSWGVPLAMWLTLRWLEDMVSSLRAAVALTRMLVLGPTALRKLRDRREDLHERVVRLATERCGLPADAELLLKNMGKGPAGRWRNALGYFSVRRRRRKDWNEVMRLFDSVDYPEDVEPM